MEFKGRVAEIFDRSGISKEGKPFKAYQILIEEQVGQYPQSGIFDIFGEKVEIPNMGDEVTVQFNMKANEWQGKYFGKNNIWKIEFDSRASSEPSVAPDPLDNIGIGAKYTQAAANQAQIETSDPGADDLPF